MSTDRKSDRDLSADGVLAESEADLRLDGRLRQQLQASSRLVPEPSARMIESLREAARQQAAAPGVGEAVGLLGWVARRPRHMWAAVGSVAVTAAAVLGLVMLQSRAGDRHALSGAATERPAIEERDGMAAIPGAVVADVAGTMPMAPEPAAGSGAPTTVASEDNLAQPTQLPAKREQRTAQMAEAKKAKAVPNVPQAALAEGSAGVLGGAARDDGDSFAAAPPPAQSANASSRALDGLDVGKGVASGRAVEIRKDQVRAAPVAELADEAAAPSDKDQEAPVVTPKASAEAQPSKPKAGSTSVANVAALAKAGRCEEAQKAAIKRRKSDAAYGEKQAGADLAPCRDTKASEKASAKPKAPMKAD